MSAVKILYSTLEGLPMHSPPLPVHEYYIIAGRLIILAVIELRHLLYFGLEVKLFKGKANTVKIKMDA